MSTSLLKFIAMIMMLLDHIWFFFDKSPYWFHWIGRIAAPIFIYCCVIAYNHTKSRKQYFIRLYLLGLVVAGLDYFQGTNLNFITIILLIIISLFLIERFQKKSKDRWVLLGIFIIFELLISIYLLSLNSRGIAEQIVYLLSNIFINIMSVDGGIIFVLMGICMNLFKEKKIKMISSLLLLTGCYLILFNTVISLKIFNYLIFIGFDLLAYIFNYCCTVLLGLTFYKINTDILYGNPQWMMIFSLPFILSFNEQKGRNNKYLFYIFYPLHIFILYKLAYY